ncbi:MAG: phosphotransferase family protein [Acetatifactor sp.]
MGITKVRLNKEELEKIVSAVFPQHTLADYTELTEGFCNTAYRLLLENGQKIIMKVTSGKRDGFMSNEVGMMDSEVKAMKIVSEQTDIRVAKVFFYDKSRKLIDGQFFLMENLDGESWYSQAALLSDDIQKKLSKETGAIQRKLTEIHSDYFGILGDNEHRFATQFEFLKYLMTNVIEDAKAVRVDFGVSVEDILESLERDKELFEEIKKPSLVHWDMWEGNIFIEKGSISGIIDWERAMWADPMMDDRFRHHTRNDAFLEGFGIVELSENEKRRILWYDVFLYLTMMTEPIYRQYEDDSQYNWIKPIFLEVWGLLGERE